MNTEEERRTGALAMAAGAVWLVIAAYAAHPVLPPSPVELPWQRTVEPVVRQLLPEGFAFFTRSPREPATYALRLDADGWTRLGHGTHAEPAYLFGVDREPRRQARQLGALVQQVPADSWHQCAESPSTCLRSAPPRSVRNPAAQPLLCGPVGVVEQQSRPWAWAALPQPVTMPSRVLNLDVSC